MDREQFTRQVKSSQKALRRFLTALCCGDSQLADDIAHDAHIDELVDVLEEVRRDERGGERCQALRGASLQKG